MTEIDHDAALWRCPACDNVQNANLELEHQICDECSYDSADRLYDPVPVDPDTLEDDMPLTLTQAESIGRHLAGVAADLRETTRQLIAARNRLAIVLEENRQLRALAGIPEQLEDLRTIASSSRALREAAIRILDAHEKDPPQ